MNSAAGGVRFGDAVLSARLIYVNALVYLAKDTDDLFYGVSFFLHGSGWFLASHNLIFNGPVSEIRSILCPITIRVVFALWVRCQARESSRRP
ncbi:MAG: hypothetical protein CMI18_10880 [Opitutaceae bacterium]|nr:hypothetical protein [Opitutaceae bacterium]|tara:strand:- start:939 stop:1217 length:279 start_codon:yes stop_codon:yes gene_type:complete